MANSLRCYNPTVSESVIRRPYPDLAAWLILIAGFCWRVWMAHATFFNTDEAWHYSVANQDSLSALYKASLTLAHPPLMVFVLYFWRHLGTSDLMIRMPGVLASTAFCWIFYKWLSLLFGRAVALSGLVFAALLPPMIALSAEVRQYGWMLMFAMASAYFLEQGLAASSPRLMLASAISLWLAMLSHYSAFLFAAALGVYTIWRMIRERPARLLVALWAFGQTVGVALAGVLYKTHIAKLGTVYPVARPLQRFGDFYIADWYFHPDRDHLLHFLYRGTLGVFRFEFGHTGVGQIAAVLFVAGVVSVMLRRNEPTRPQKLALAGLLIAPFVVNWIAVAAGLFPYGRTRQCIFLAIFGFAGVAIALVRICRDRTFAAAAVALALAAFCHLFGTLQGRDMLPLSDQRHEHMDAALEFLHDNVTSADVIVTDRATKFQLEHYLCRHEQKKKESPAQGFDSFECGGLRVVSTGANDGALTAENFASESAHVKEAYGLNPAKTWVVQGGWATGLGESLRSQLRGYESMRVHSFGHYLEVFQVPSS